MATTNEKAANKVITDKVRMSYVHAFEPVAVQEGQDKKYSVSIVIPKSAKGMIRRINEAIEAAKEMGKAKSFGGKLPANLKLPLRDGDAERPDDPVYENAFFINCTSKQKPQIIDEKGNPIIDPEGFYSGCYGRVSINFYSFNKAGSKGIAAGLNNLQFLEDGEQLSGRTSAMEDFGVTGDDDDDDI